LPSGAAPCCRSPGAWRRPLEAWLGPAFGEHLRLTYDADQVDALPAEREAVWARVAAADFLTVNEKRAAVGYEPVEGGDGSAAG
jgi:phage portal protein BeeE